VLTRRNISARRERFSLGRNISCLDARSGPSTLARTSLAAALCSLPQPKMRKDTSGYWIAFLPGAGFLCRHYVAGNASSGFKRDTYARELTNYHPLNCSFILRNIDVYPLHDTGLVNQDFSALISYQFQLRRPRDLHVRRPFKHSRHGSKLESVADLGVISPTALRLSRFALWTSLCAAHAVQRLVFGKT
jgi:hypothetical protein